MPNSGRRDTADHCGPPAEQLPRMPRLQFETMHLLCHGGRSETSGRKIPFLSRPLREHHRDFPRPLLWSVPLPGGSVCTAGASE